MNYFSLFGLPINYQINMQQLKSAFYSLQCQFHPDKFVNSSESEKIMALRKSAFINTAWQTLRDPLLRAEYILSMHGFDSSRIKKYSLQNEDFFLEQLKLQEDLDEIEQTKNKSRLETTTKNVKRVFNDEFTKMIKLLNKKKWDMALNILYNLRFLDKFINRLEQVEEKLICF